MQGKLNSNSVRDEVLKAKIKPYAVVNIASELGSISKEVLISGGCIAKHPPLFLWQSMALTDTNWVCYRVIYTVSTFIQCPGEVEAEV